MTLSNRILGYLLFATVLRLQAALPLPGGVKWAVIAPASIDRRITAQISGLAAQAHAEIVNATDEAEAKSDGAALILQLQQTDPDSLLQELKRVVQAPASPPTPELARDGYILEWSNSGSPPRVKITAGTPEGLHNALLRIPRVLEWAGPDRNRAMPWLPAPKKMIENREPGSRSLTVADFPSFPQRGVVEGFYGKPWTQQDRLDILRFEGEHGMNVYYYAPKDDPYHRKLWREPYPPAQMQRLAELVSAARTNFVDFAFAISPGLSVVYSNDQDFTGLTAKLDSVAALGVTQFALFLDDVPPDLQDPGDLQRFNTLAAAHVYFVNKLYQYLVARSPANRLTVTPTTYTNDWGSRDYIREMGVGIDSHVDLVWTGTKVVSPVITVEQAIEWGQLLNRKPLVWDNFPVNDGIPWRLNLGPMRGRDPRLPAAVAGLFANPMNQPHASMIPLQTVADYLWNSEDYDSDASYRKALNDQYGEDARRLLGAFLDAYGDYWWDDNIFKPLFTEQRRPFNVPAMERRIGALNSSLSPLKQDVRFQKLVPEISPLPSRTAERLRKVVADPAFRHLPGGKLVWRVDYDVLHASRARVAPLLDGNFRKWRTAQIYRLGRANQIVAGRSLWKGPRQFSARVAFAWDRNYLYIGVDLTDPELYQPFAGRNISKGDLFAINLETAFRKNFFSRSADGDEYRLLFSPGNFSGTRPGVWSEEDYLPPRPHPRDFANEIRTAWKKTATGFSGDIAIPMYYFAAGRFHPGYEIGLSFSIQKHFPPPPGRAANEDDESRRILFTSKADTLFRASFGNPSSYQRLVLR